MKETGIFLYLMQRLLTKRIKRVKRIKIYWKMFDKSHKKIKNILNIELNYYIIKKKGNENGYIVKN